MQGGDSTRIILESISDGVFTVDADWRITSFNRAAEEITGVPRAEAIGSPCSEVFRASMCEADCALRRTLATGTPIINRAAFIVDADGRRIPVSVSTALLRDAGGNVIGGAETFRDLSLVEQLRREAADESRLGELVSNSPLMRRLFASVPQIAATDCTVLICGETGTGKELLARAIHAHSARRDHPFIAINCGALPETLLESELFGHVTGAFTGAGRDRPGRFALAEGGTILLDEIGEISPAFQVRLLRVLQERVYEPLGSGRSVRADVRVIAATHRDLPAMVKAGTFREDLFYRINVVRLDLPPLRQRREDIPALVSHLMERLNRRHGKAITGLAGEVMGLLLAHDFPGNVRELENILEHAFVICEGSHLEVAHLPSTLTGAGARRGDSTMAAAVQAVEGESILTALRKHHGNRTAAARELGMHKSTFFRKVKALGLELPRTDGRRR